jgi:hypothetical protein
MLDILKCFWTVKCEELGRYPCRLAAAAGRAAVPLASLGPAAVAAGLPA